MYEIEGEDLPPRTRPAGERALDYFLPGARHISRLIEATPWDAQNPYN
jgi:hypothetical protein